MRKENRINDPKFINRRKIKNLLNDKTDVIIQFSDKIYTDRILSKLNKLCGKYNSSLGIRFYGHYSKIFDFEILKKLTNVKSLYIDCIQDAKNIEALYELENLQILSIGIYELKELEILKSIKHNSLERLYLGETSTKALNLEYLKNYKTLKHLIISGHTKKIESLKHLYELETLGLNSIPKYANFHFINSLHNLKELRITLGGRNDLREIEINEIEKLEIIRVRGLSNLENISNFKHLKTLIVEDQIRLEKLNFDKNLLELNDIKIINCKNLKEVSGLENLPDLQKLRIYKTKILFEDFIKQKMPNSLKILAFYTTKTSSDKVIRDRLNQLNYSEH